MKQRKVNERSPNETIAKKSFDALAEVACLLNRERIDMEAKIRALEVINQGHKEMMNLIEDIARSAEWDGVMPFSDFHKRAIAIVNQYLQSTNKP